MKEMAMLDGQGLNAMLMCGSMKADLSPCGCGRTLADKE